MKKTIDRIAREILQLETLEPRKRDCLGFHELSVWASVSRTPVSL